MSPLSIDGLLESSHETADDPQTSPTEESAMRLAPIVSLRTGRCWAVESTIVAPSALARTCTRWVQAAPTNGALGLALRLAPAPLAEIEHALAALGRTLEDAQIARGRISLELENHHTTDVVSAITVARACRAEGFLVVSTEVGVGHPHVERIESLAPDVLKIDARLVRGVASSRGRLEACHAVMELARSMGALMIADGVASVEDLVELAMLGIDLFEGPVIGEGTALPSAGIAEAQTSTDVLRRRLRQRGEEEVLRRRAERAVHDRVFVTVMSRIAQARAKELDLVAEQIVCDVEGLDALYVLDQRGVQLTKTWFSPGIVARGGFQPAERGSDLGLKDYFLEVGHGAGYISRPYVSMASGRLSVTHSRRLRLCDSTNVVVCCDVPSTIA